MHRKSIMLIKLLQLNGHTGWQQAAFKQLVRKIGYCDPTVKVTVTWPHTIHTLPAVPFTLKVTLLPSSCVFVPVWPVHNRKCWLAGSTSVQPFVKWLQAAFSDEEYGCLAKVSPKAVQEQWKQTVSSIRGRMWKSNVSEDAFVFQPPSQTCLLAAWILPQGGKGEKL